MTTHHHHHSTAEDPGVPAVPLPPAPLLTTLPRTTTDPLHRHLPHMATPPRTLAPPTTTNNTAAGPEDQDHRGIVTFPRSYRTFRHGVPKHRGRVKMKRHLIIPRNEPPRLPFRQTFTLQRNHAPRVKPHSCRGWGRGQRSERRSQGN